MNKGRCDICGQRLTDASGSWTVHFRYTGCMGRPSHKLRTCSACQEIIAGYIGELAEVRTAKRKAEGWGE